MDGAVAGVISDYVDFRRARDGKMGQDTITTEERDLIERAVAAGLVRRVGKRREVNSAPAFDWSAIERHKRIAVPPEPYRPPSRLSVRGALEWAFAVECAQMEADELAESSGGLRRARGTEAAIAERAALGNVTIDASPGRSWPADEAELIASALRNALPWRDAVWVAELARLRMAPAVLDPETRRVVPVSWTHGRGGPRGRTVNLCDHRVTSSLGLPDRGGWPESACVRRNRKGVVVQDPILATPVTITPTASQIGASRRQWLDWWGHLLSVKAALGGRVGRIEITDEMPPMEPWKGGSK